MERVRYASLFLQFAVTALCHCVAPMGKLIINLVIFSTHCQKRSRRIAGHDCVALRTMARNPSNRESQGLAPRTSSHCSVKSYPVPIHDERSESRAS